MSTNEMIVQLNKQKQRAEFFIIFSTIPLIISGLLIVNSGFNIFWPVIIVFIIALGFSITGSILYTKVKETFRHAFIKRYFDELDNIDYVPKKAFGKSIGLTKEEVYGSNFLSKAHLFDSFDCLEGEIDGISFKSSDVHLQNQHSTGKTSYTVTTFLGRMFIFDFRKPVNGEVLVLEDYKPTAAARKYERVKTESIAFEKIFNTYSKIPQTAFYILTPHFMERLMTLEKNHPGKIGLSFKDNQLILAIYTNKRTFTLKFMQQIDKAFLETIKEDIHIIESLVHALKLNDNVYV